MRAVTTAMRWPTPAVEQQLSFRLAQFSMARDATERGMRGIARED